MLALLLTAAWGLFSWCVAQRGWSEAGAATRLAAAAVIGAWSAVAVFFALASLGLFTRTWSLAVWLLLAGAALRGRGPQARRCAEEDAARTRHLWHALRGSAARPLAVGVASFLALYGLRGLAAPPLGWDALSYHLVHAARWVSTGGFFPVAAPDAWSYYEHFPAAGDALWAWAMLPLHSDALLAVAGVALVLAVALGSHACARELGAPAPRAALAALSLTALPAVLRYSTAAYVDNAVVAGAALGSVFVARACARPRWQECALAAGAFGLCAAIKPSAAPLLALAGLAVLLAAARTRRRVPWASLAAAAAGASIVLPHALRTWWTTGSPVYPFSLRLFGAPIFAGNAQMEAILVGEIGGTPERSLAGLLAGLFWPDPLNHYNFGPGGLALLGLGLAALVRELRRPEKRGFAGFGLAAALCAVLLVSGERAANFRGHWWDTSGRYLLPSLVPAAAAAAGWSGRGGAWLLGLGCAVSLALSLPAGWGAHGARGAAAVAGGVAGAAALALAARRLLPRPAWLVTGLLLLGALGTGLDALRAALRQPLYRDAAERRVWDPEPLDPRFAPWRLWGQLDRLPPSRLAIAAGWSGIGHNVYRYPLFGASLQHTLLYLPSSRSGAIVDYRDVQLALESADFEAWLARLLRERIDLVVVLAPASTPEHQWVARAPRLFERVAGTIDSGNAAYRFRADRARQRLEAL